MIIKTNNEKREYILNECEKQEIQEIYVLGGRYFYAPHIEDTYVNIYTNNEPIPGKEIFTVYGPTVNILRELSMECAENLKSVFDIMQLYPNTRQIILTEYDKDILRYVYDKLGGRYIKEAYGKYLIHDDENKNIHTEFARFENLVFYLKRFAVDEISDKRGISIEKIINKFCK